MSDVIEFAPDDAGEVVNAATAWPVLVVDDDQEVQAVTRLALRDCVVDGRPLLLLSAHSAAEARTVLEQYKNIALILLDVVMESEHAGLELVHHIREVGGNQRVRVVLRTGQPGQAPAREILSRYQIDDYRTKTELNFERLQVLVTTALRTYQALADLDKRNQELARSNQELERFAYIASHDLQTPLRGIISFTQLLSQRFSDVLDDRGREYVNYIVQGGRDLQRLIQDLLEYSRVSRAVVQHHWVDLNVVLSRAIADLQPEIARRAAEVIQQPLPKVWGDEVQLTLLFRNLIDNALKFQPGERPWVRIAAQEQGPRTRVTVTDGGIGIAENHRQQIFEVFMRLHTQEEYPGSGMGLALCRKIALLHGADLSVNSSLGQGTVLGVSLPLAPPEAPHISTQISDGLRVPLPQTAQTMRHAYPH